MTRMKFQYIQNATFVFILTIVSLTFLWILKDYAMPIFWALVLAIVFSPMNEFLAKKFKDKRALSASVSLLAIVLLIIVPSSLLGALFVKELSALYEKSAMQIEMGGLQNIGSGFVEKLPLISDFESLKNKALESMKSYGDNISSFAFGVGKSSIEFVVKFMVMLYVLFFFLKDGQLWVKRIKEVLPLGSRKENYLLSKFSEMVRAVFKGSFVIALLQGALGGTLFWIVGIPSPIVWAALMMLLAFIPALGPAVIWAPAALLLFLSGDTLGALVLLLGGVFLVGTIDNFLRPYLVGKNTNMPDLLIFLSVLGAISIFGVAGVVIGPVLSALFLAVWELFEKEFKDELHKWG